MSKMVRPRQGTLSPRAAMVALIGTAAGLGPSPLPAAADETRGWYIGMAAGATIPLNVEDSNGNTAQFDIGRVASLSGGFRFNEALRLQLDFRHSHYELDKSVGNLDWYYESGAMTHNALLMTGLVDFRPFGKKLIPHVGVSLGVAHTTSDDFIKRANFGSGMAGIDEYTFAYQMTAGAGYRLNGDLTLDFDYNYFTITDVKMETDRGNEGKQAGFGSHNFMLGLRYDF